MKNFFIIVFGGLACLAIGSAIAFFIPKLNYKAVVTKSAPLVVFTAEQEEDVIDSAAKAYPNGTSTAISANAYIVNDITNGVTIFERDSDRLIPIASLVKLITAVVARQNMDSDTKITVGPRILSVYGNTAGFKNGEIYTAGDLIYPLLMVSSNGAAEALARGYDREKFIKLMNDFAQSIGAYHTYLSDPAGLSAKNVSSASDVAKILEWIMRHDPTILEITRLKSKTIRNHTWVNPAHALSWSYYLGGKNGYIPESNRTTAGLFTFDESKTIYAVIALGSASRDIDMITLLGMIKKYALEKSK